MRKRVGPVAVVLLAIVLAGAPNLNALSKRLWQRHAERQAVERAQLAQRQMENALSLLAIERELAQARQEKRQRLVSTVWRVDHFVLHDQIGAEFTYNEVVLCDRAWPEHRLYVEYARGYPPLLVPGTLLRVDLTTDQPPFTGSEARPGAIAIDGAIVPPFNLKVADHEATS